MDTLSRKSDTAAAILYALKLWSVLLAYCDGGAIEIDNSAAERALRGIAIGRRTQLTTTSPIGNSLDLSRITADYPGTRDIGTVKFQQFSQELRVASPKD